MYTEALKVPYSESSDNNLLNFSGISLQNFKGWKRVEISDILQKICVLPPYFAFKEMYRCGNVIMAPIDSQQDIEFEVTPMSSAEAGRHLAILGSCSLAIDESEKNYYLAHKAFKRGCINKGVVFDGNDKLYALSVPNILGSEKHPTISAYTSLVNQNGDAIFEMNVVFQKVSVKLFNRVFKSYLRDTKEIDYNPYTKVFRLQNIVENERGITAELPQVSDDDCSGHFKNAPMLPVGTLSYIITNHVGQLLRKNDSEMDARYALVSADLELFEPTNTRSREFVEITYNGKSGNVHDISWVVRGENGKEKNRMRLLFSKQ